MRGALDPASARRAWQRFEPLHAVTYFAPACIERAARDGLKGFWMGYFANRAAPMGPVPPGVVEATFFSFHPARVRRALPDAWAHASPAGLVAARRDAAATVLREAVPALEEQAPRVVALLARVVEAMAVAGRPLAGANRDVAPVGDPVEDLWQAATTLREHRGDGHVAALTDAGLDGCEALVLFAATTDVPADLLRQARGWPEEDWAAAEERLTARGLAPSGEAARRLRDDIERRTDELGVRPYGALDEGERQELVTRLGELAAAVVRAGIVPFPNPMGAPPPA